MHTRLILLALFAALCLQKAGAQRLNAFSVAHTDILDTYLSQERFSGTEVSYLNQRIRTRDSSRVSTSLTHHASLGVAGTRSHSQTLLSALYNLRFGWHYNWTFPAQHLSLRLGGVCDLTLGGAYDTRNSNNPAQARLAFSVDPAAALSWQFCLGHRQLTLTYAAAMPLAGVAFSPNYGQSYYEIFSQGNYDHNVVFISPFSGPQLHQMLTLDIPLRRTSLTVGYLCDLLQMSANSLKYHQYSHGIMIGWKY